MKKFRSLFIKLVLVFLSAGFLAMSHADSVVMATNLPAIGSVWVNGSNVNVRQKPDIKSKSLGKVSTGTELTLYEKRNDGWSCVDYKGSSAYIKSDFLSDKKVTSAKTTNSTKAASNKKSSSGTKKSSNAGIAATSTTSSAGTVYITEKGKCYHRIPNCGNMKSAIATTVDQAVASGRSACKNCF